LSMYANGSGRTGAVSRSAHENGAGAEETAEAEIGDCDDAGVVARFDQPAAEEGEKAEVPTLLPVPLPDPPPLMRALDCDVSGSVTEGKVEMLSGFPSMSSIRRLTGRRRGSSPNSSRGRAGPCKKLATAADAVPYNHAIGKASVSLACSASPCKIPSRVVGPEGSGTASPTRPLPLLMDGTVSRKLVYPPPPGCGGSMSMSCIRERSMTMSPLIAQPPVPYPPALTDGENPCLLQKIIILQACQRSQDWEGESGGKGAYCETSCASRGSTTAFEVFKTFPLNRRVCS
jgi:hypothetical protein